MTVKELVLESDARIDNMAKKIISVSKRDIDVSGPCWSISGKGHEKAIEKARGKAKKEGRRLITREGIEDYSKGEENGRD
jgi:hypothetical protein